MTRGILVTCYAPARKDASLTTDRLRALYADFYAASPFVRVADTPPATKQTLGSNDCLLYPTFDERTERVVVVSVLDNLMKGGAGQGIQCLNLMLGLPEHAGLQGLALYP
jgi:N-acetyl-gamma-glutamyl-phosphate reductase